MDFFGPKSIPLYFIYGLAFFTMGISALQQSNKKISNFPLMKALIYLAGFGLVHGLSEWVSMIIIADSYPEYIVQQYQFKMFLNATSFASLFAFGFALFEFKDYKLEKLKKLPWVLLTIWALGFFIMDWLYPDVATNIKYPMYSTMSRYFIGLPGGILVAYALYQNSEVMRNLNLKIISLKFKALAVVFLMYGIFAGLIVSQQNFFPANVINKNVFEIIFGLPIEAARTFSAIIITFLFIDIIKIFTWEVNEKISRLIQVQAATQERRKLGRELHDVLIQKLFATGLRAEFLMEDEDNPGNKEQLMEIKEDLNEVISDIRGFIARFSPKKIEVEDLKANITELVEKFQEWKTVLIKLNYEVPAIALGQLSNEKLTQVYYIVQEALSNVIKHSKATEAEVTIKSTLRELIVIISDNGVGVDLMSIKSDSFGIKSIKERASVADGTLAIKTNTMGTTITLTIPWEEFQND